MLFRSVLSDVDDAIARALHQFGRALGIAFQIQDDLLDLSGDERVVGKSIGKDLGKGKLTLPLIYHLHSAGQSERGRTLRLIEQKDGEALHETLAASGAIDEATQTANRLVNEALEHLETVPEGPGRSMLSAMAQAVIARSH